MAQVPPLPPDLKSRHRRLTARANLNFYKFSAALADVRYGGDLAPLRWFDPPAGGAAERIRGVGRRSCRLVGALRVKPMPGSTRARSIADGGGMYFHEYLMKARQDEMLREAARDRLAADARRACEANAERVVPAPARRLIRLPLRRVPV